jgi:hypothetical protein
LALNTSQSLGIVSPDARISSSNRAGRATSTAPPRAVVPSQPVRIHEITRKVNEDKHKWTLTSFDKNQLSNVVLCRVMHPKGVDKKLVLTKFETTKKLTPS